MKRTAKKISIVLPVINEEANAVILYYELCRTIKNLLIPDYEIVFVDNGSQDKTRELVSEIAEKDSRVSLIIARNYYDKDLALLEGISKASGDVIAFMDADLQHPPQFLIGFYKKWQEGRDVIIAEKQKKSHGLYYFFYVFAIFLFDKLFELKLNLSDFGLIDRKIKKIVLKRYISLPFRLILSSLILSEAERTETVLYVPGKRLYGRSKFSFIKLIILYLYFIQVATLYYRKKVIFILLNIFLLAVIYYMDSLVDKDNFWFSFLSIFSLISLLFVVHKKMLLHFGRARKLFAGRT